jgi:hypothetical protein
LKTIVDAKHTDKELGRWRGAQAKIWMFHTTHKRLALMLTRRNEPEVIYIVANGCEHIAGPFSWKGSNVSIERLTGSADQANCRIVDAAAGFTLQCSDAIVVIAPATKFPTSFDDFLGS